MQERVQTRFCPITRVGQNRIYTPYMTVYLVISLPKMPYTHRIYVVLANPTYNSSGVNLFGKRIVQAGSCLHSEQIDTLFTSVGGQEGGIGGGGAIWGRGPKFTRDCQEFCFNSLFMIFANLNASLPVVTRILLHCFFILSLALHVCLHTTGNNAASFHRQIPVPTILYQLAANHTSAANHTCAAATPPHPRSFHCCAFSLQPLVDDSFQRLCSAASNDPEMGIRCAALHGLQGE